MFVSLLAEYINNSHLVLVSGRKGQRGGVMKESRKIWKGGGEREGGKEKEGKG